MKINTLEQVAIVYVITFLTIVLASWTGDVKSIHDVTFLGTAALAAVPAALRAIVAALTKLKGDPTSGSFLS